MSRRLAAPIAVAAAGVAAAPAIAADLRATTASWYGPGLFGNALGCTEYGTLRPWTRGVAHKTLDCGTRIRVCARRCRTTLVVDRGPYVAGREFDLTQAFAGAIGFYGVGTVYVRVIR